MLNKKTIGTLALAGVLTTGLLAACGSTSTSSSSSNSSSTTQQSIRVAADTTFPPFESEVNGKVQGFDIDMINDIAKKENLKVNISTMQFTGLIPALQAKSIDVAVAGITIKKSRMAAVDFSNAYYKSGISVLVKKGSSIKSISDLKTKNVATKKGTSSIDLLKSKGVPDSNVKQYDQITDAYNALASGGVDAVVFDSPVNQDYVNNHKQFQVVQTIPTDEYYGIAVVKNNPDLLKKINEGLQAIKDDGEYAKLFNKYFGGDTSGLVKNTLAPDKVALNE